MVGPIFFVGTLFVAIATMLVRIRRLEKSVAEYQSRSLLAAQVAAEDNRYNEAKVQNQTRIEVTESVRTSVLDELALFRDAVVAELPRVVEERTLAAVAAHLSESCTLIESMKTVLASGFLTQAQLDTALSAERSRPRTSSESALLAHPILHAVGQGIRMERHVGVASGSVITLRDYPFSSSCSVSINNRWLASHEYYVCGSSLQLSGVYVNPTDEILVVYLSSLAGGCLA